jgi:hypothetical protein
MNNDKYAHINNTYWLKFLISLMFPKSLARSSACRGRVPALDSKGIM